MPQPLTEQEMLAAYRGARNASRPQAPQGSSRPAAGSDERSMIADYRNSRPMGWMEDAARSAVSGAEQGVTGLIGLPHALSDVQNTATDWLANQVRAGLKQPPMTQAQQQRLHQVTAAMSGASPFGIVNPNAPSAAQMNAGVQRVAGPYHDPQTSQGRLAETVGEMAPGALLPGGIAARAARVAVPAASSDAAGEVFRGTPYEGAARFVGGAAGGLLEGGAEAVGNAPARVMGNASRGLSQTDADLATALRDSAARQGISLTIPEAVQHVTGGATSLGRVQRIVESTGRTAPQMSAYMAERPQQVRDAAMGFAGRVAPDNPPAPGSLGLATQGSAQGVADNLASERTALVNPYYAAANGASVAQGDMDELIQALDSRIGADKTGIVAKPLSRARGMLVDMDATKALSEGQVSPAATSRGAAEQAWSQLTGDAPVQFPGSAPRDVPITDLENLDRARKFIRDDASSSVDRGSMTPEQGAALTGVSDHLDKLLERASPDFVGGKANYADFTRDVIDPVLAGPIGRLKGTADLGSQTNALYPHNPPLGQPAETARAISLLGEQPLGQVDNTIGRALTSQHIANAFNQSTRDLTSGPNQYGGALFARNIAGNAEQAQTLDAGLNALDPSGHLQSQWGDIVDALRATGARERPGSMTAFNAEDLNGLKQAPGLVKFLGGLGDPLEWTKNLSNATGGLLYRRNLDALADMLIDPDTASVLQRAASARGGAPFGSQAVIPALTQQGAGQ